MKRIIVVNLNKEFKLNRKGSISTLARMLGLFSANSLAVTSAEGVSFDVEAGESVGLIGRNGSGKSTLLRLIAGIYREDSGEIRTEGRLIFLNGYGQGLQPRLTMRENIFLAGALMGLSPAEIRNKFDEIVEFSGLNKFVDAKIYQFSSGMLTRLSFSVTILCIKHQNPDILLLDEIFSAGADMDFQARALAKMKELIYGGASVILVSHHMETIRTYCDRVIWMEKGRIVDDGDPDRVIDEYIRSNRKA
jgi:ABC-type polysaccharide/polyol phosphate transport system ATPase subunit